MIGVPKDGEYAFGWVPILGEWLYSGVSLASAAAVNVFNMLLPKPRLSSEAAHQASSTELHELLPLVDLVGFKWLLAAEGVHLHVQRAQHDLAYISHTLEQARQSTSATLRSHAELLAQRIAHRP